MIMTTTTGSQDRCHHQGRQHLYPAMPSSTRLPLQETNLNQKRRRRRRRRPAAAQETKRDHETQTATLWLLKYEGIRDIIIAGADPGKGYHQLFIDRAKYNKDGTPAFNGQSTAPQPVEVYQKCWDQGIKWANHYGAKIRHINNVSDDELINLGIN